MPDSLQNELVRRAIARDAQAKIGSLDPRTTPVTPTRLDPFSSPDLMHKVGNTIVDPSNWGGAGGVAAGTTEIPVLSLLEKLHMEQPIAAPLEKSAVHTTDDLFNFLSQRAVQHPDLHPQPPSAYENAHSWFDTTP